MDVDVIVPGHGPVGSRNELAKTRAYLDLIARNTVRLYAEFNGTITPANDTNAQNQAVAEYTRLRARN
jgi:hypothetical protein